MGGGGGEHGSYAVRTASKNDSDLFNDELDLYTSHSKSFFLFSLQSTQPAFMATRARVPAAFSCLILKRCQSVSRGSDEKTKDMEERVL